MTEDRARQIIAKTKKEMGKELVILGHHYQCDKVIEFADYVGDSLELARKVSQMRDAKIIIFCGVYFMAETASILAPDKYVYIPDEKAGCLLADMAPIELANKAWETIIKYATNIIPITYVNSSAEIKALCGKNGGSVCTSGNSAKVFKWVLQQDKKIFFLPDRNLGRNSAHALGVPDSEIIEWNPYLHMGGHNIKSIQDARIILWRGWCPIHWPTFTTYDIDNIRKSFPGIKVIVHPEADPETIKNSDASGSTSSIINFIEEQQPGNKIAVGTEFNMVNRLAQKKEGMVEILPLDRVTCEDMGKITLEKLAECLANLKKCNRVIVSPSVAKYAKKALEKMLRI